MEKLMESSKSVIEKMFLPLNVTFLLILYKNKLLAATVLENGHLI